MVRYSYLFLEFLTILIFLFLKVDFLHRRLFLTQVRVSVNSKSKINHSLIFFQILVHVGFLTEESGDVFSPNVLKGGPLGEMVQWADILTALHMLGHNLKISVSLKELHG